MPGCRVARRDRPTPTGASSRRCGLTLAERAVVHVRAGEPRATTASAVAADDDRRVLEDSTRRIATDTTAPVASLRPRCAALSAMLERRLHRRLLVRRPLRHRQSYGPARVDPRPCSSATVPDADVRCRRTGEGVQLAWGPEDEAFRAELVAFLDAHTARERARRLRLPGRRRRRARARPAVDARLAGDALRPRLDDPRLPARARRPELHTGADAHLSRDARGRRIPRSGHFPGYAIVAPSLLEFGNDEQQALAPAAIRGDTIWCIGMSEPNAGSDLAGLQTRAEVFDDHFVVNGQKVWTSYAMIAQKCFCYVRTDPTLPKHKGISLLIVDMDTPGIDIRPLRHLNGTAGFAEVFFTDVVVPRENLVGAAQRRLGDHARLARARARRAVGRGRRPVRADRRRPRRPRAPHRAGRRPDRPPQDRGSPTSSRRACARSATRASRRSRRVRRRPSTAT